MFSINAFAVESSVIDNVIATANYDHLFAPGVGKVEAEQNSDKISKTDLKKYLNKQFKIRHKN